MGAVEDVYEPDGRTAEAAAARGSGRLPGKVVLRLGWTSAVSHDAQSRDRERAEGGLIILVS